MKETPLPLSFYANMCKLCKYSPVACGMDPEECALRIKPNQVPKIKRLMKKAREQND
jgi:hypothetical protein